MQFSIRKELDRGLNQTKGRDDQALQHLSVSYLEVIMSQFMSQVMVQVMSHLCHASFLMMWHVPSHVKSHVFIMS